MGKGILGRSKSREVGSVSFAQETAWLMYEGKRRQRSLRSQWTTSRDAEQGLHG